MKTMILAVFAALTLSMGVAGAQTLSHGAPPAHQQSSQNNWLAGGGG